MKLENIELEDIADLLIIIIIIKQLVTQNLSVKNELTNRRCGLVTAVSDGKIC